MLRRLLLVGIAIAALALAAASTASALSGPFYGKIKYSSGSLCGSGSCQFVGIDVFNVGPAIVQTGSLQTNDHFCGDSWPDNNLLMCEISIQFNARIVDNPGWYDSDDILFYGRQPCPGGGYHFSPVHHWDPSSYWPWWGGTFQLGSGCQT